MNALGAILATDYAEQREPTLEERLRYIDLCLECAAEAKRLFPAPTNGWLETDHALPASNPSFGPAYRFLRIKAMRAEGLPLSLIGDERSAGERLWTETNRLKGVPHTFTPKPLSKRARRRLRGKQKEAPHAD